MDDTLQKSIFNSQNNGKIAVRGMTKPFRIEIIDNCTPSNTTYDYINRTDIFWHYQLEFYYIFQNKFKLTSKIYL